MTGQIVYAGYAIPDGAAVRDFAVYIEADHIVVTGTRAELTRQYPDVPVFGGDDLIMMPGFVNAHDHGRSIGTQSLGVPDSFLEVWLNDLGRLPALPSYLAAAWEGLQLVKSGVTGTAHSHNPSSWETQFEEIPPTLRGYADAGVRVAMHPVIIDQNPLVYADADKFIASLPEHLQDEATRRNQPPPLTADAYFAGLDALYKQYHDTETHRVHIQASPAGGQWCSDELIRRAVKWAKGHNTRVQMHMLETPYQRIYAFRKWGKSFVRHLNDIYALGNWLTLAHMVWMEDDEANLLAEAGVGIAHNPSSNLRLRSGIAPVAKMMIAHARLVGIGMDGHTLDEDHDFLREMRLAWTLANRPGMTNAGVTAGEILFAAFTRSQPCPPGVFPTATPALRPSR
ncbi:MAG: amidohydrolase family protein, partial [Chloroflexota bacterium]